MCGNTPIVVFPNGDLGLVGLTGALSPDASTGAEDVAAVVEDNVILADDDDAPPGSGGDGSSTRGNCAALSFPGRGGHLVSPTLSRNPLPLLFQLSTQTQTQTQLLQISVVLRGKHSVS